MNGTRLDNTTERACIECDAVYTGQLSCPVCGQGFGEPLAETETCTETMTTFIAYDIPSETETMTTASRSFFRALSLKRKATTRSLTQSRLTSDERARLARLIASGPCGLVDDVAQSLSNKGWIQSYEYCDGSPADRYELADGGYGKDGNSWVYDSSGAWLSFLIKKEA